ncbi:MAG: hypothetical protein M0C28_24055 [Candidatus Moduliflexus flocculans]|nr:hypothetical protein [Candidatus Moduliflexus flocculans]
MDPGVRDRIVAAAGHRPGTSRRRDRSRDGDLDRAPCSGPAPASWRLSWTGTLAQAAARALGRQPAIRHADRPMPWNSTSPRRFATIRGAGRVAGGGQYPVLHHHAADPPARVSAGNCSTAVAPDRAARGGGAPHRRAGEEDLRRPDAGLSILGQCPCGGRHPADRRSIRSPRWTRRSVRFDLLDAPAGTGARNRRSSSAVIRAAFAVRRKTLRNALCRAGWPARDGGACASGAPASRRWRRGETLTLDEFARLSEALPVAAVPRPRGGRAPESGPG